MALKSVYKGKLLHIFRGPHKLPHGKIMDCEIIKHPGAALIVPFLDKKTVIMVRQYRAAIGAFIYEFPAGTLEYGERPIVCARREVEEETGFRAGTITSLGKIYPVPGYSTEVIYFYKAEGLTASRRDLDPDEHMENRVMTVTQLKRLFKQGKIHDAKSICALAMCGLV